MAAVDRARSRSIESLARRNVVYSRGCRFGTAALDRAARPLSIILRNRLFASADYLCFLVACWTGDCDRHCPISFSTVACALAGIGDRRTFRGVLLYRARLSWRA